MIRLVQLFDPPEGIVYGNPLIINFLRVADDACDGTEAACHPHGARIGKRRQPSLEHARVELVGLAVHVDIAAGEMRAHQRMAALHHAEEKLVHEGVLGSPQRRQLEPCRGEKRTRIHASAVGRIEHDRTDPFGWLENFERRIELVSHFGHVARAVGGSWLRLDVYFAPKKCPRISCWLFTRSQQWHFLCGGRNCQAACWFTPCLPSFWLME